MSTRSSTLLVGAAAAAAWSAFVTDAAPVRVLVAAVLVLLVGTSVARRLPVDPAALRRGLAVLVGALVAAAVELLAQLSSPGAWAAAAAVVLAVSSTTLLRPARPQGVLGRRAVPAGDCPPLRATAIASRRNASSRTVPGRGSSLQR